MIDQEIKYWDKAAVDPQVDDKYICNINDPKFDELIRFDGKVLEIGCGVGRLMRSGWFGIDISPKMLEIAKTRRPNCIFKLCDGNIPYPKKFFNAVYSVLVFQHIPFNEFENYVVETSNVLVDGGTFLFQFIEGDETEPFSNHYKLDDVKKVLKNNKLDITYLQKGIIHPMWSWIKCKKEA